MNLNDKLIDELILISVRNEKAKGATSRKVLRSLKDLDRDVISLLAESGLTEYNQRRLNKLSREIREAVKSLYATAQEVVEGDARANVDRVIGQTQVAYNGVIGVPVAVAPSINRAYTVATSNPYMGFVMRDHWARLPATVSRLIEDQIRLGYMASETQNQINARVRRVTRGQAVNLTRSAVNTAIGHFQSDADQAFLSRNKRIFKSYKLVATLDTRTTDICMSRDGREYKVGEQPPLPFHYNERSRYVGVVKSWKAQDFEVPESTRASMDGQVSDKLNYKDWLSRQSFSRRSEALGSKTAKLLRDTSLDLDDIFLPNRVMSYREILSKYPDISSG